jgi:dTDP-4-dehydrorhamnose 3,5-epimerase
MELSRLSIDGAWLAESQIWSDERGSFREWFKAKEIQHITGESFQVEQANISISSAGTLRGIHYSLAPGGQAKWVTCVSGSIKDVIVDIRPQSPTFGKWIEVELKGNSGKAVFIGKDLGHAFLALEDNTSVAYLVTSRFSPEYEFEINPIDDKIGITWGMKIDELKISEKDRNAPTLEEQLSKKRLPK